MTDWSVAPGKSRTGLLQASTPFNPGQVANAAEHNQDVSQLDAGQGVAHGLKPMELSPLQNRIPWGAAEVSTLAEVPGKGKGHLSHLLPVGTGTDNWHAIAESGRIIPV